MYHTTQANIRNSHELCRLLDQPALPESTTNNDSTLIENKIENEKCSKALLSSKTATNICSWQTEPYPQEDLDNSFVLGNN